MGSGDGVVGAMQKIVDHGSELTHWNWVVLAEGYQQGELVKFDNDFNSLSAHLAAVLTTGSFAGSGCWDRINLYKLPIASTASGADNDSPAGCGSPVQKATFLDGRYFYDGITQRWLVVDPAQAAGDGGALAPEHARQDGLEARVTHVSTARLTAPSSCACGR